VVKFFSSLNNTLYAGLGVLLALIILSGLITGHWIGISAMPWWTFLMRVLHIMSGVMWIGILWYFNFVQTPTMPTIQPVEARVAITGFILPNALWWFRYGALSTVVTGLLLAWMNGYIWNALLLKTGFHGIGIGMWLALIMAFNVWFIIWPNQKKVIGVTPANADEKAAAGRVAGMTSRINTMLSIPMLYCMASQSFGGF